jgi:hypothetical protein
MRIAFRPNSDFDEAVLYTTDVWLREEEFKEDALAPPYVPAVVAYQEVVNPLPLIQPAVSTSQAAPEWSFPELDWDLATCSVAPIPHLVGAVNEVSGEPIDTAIVHPGAEPTEVGIVLPLPVAEPEPLPSLSDGEQSHRAESMSAPPPSVANLDVVMESNTSISHPPPRLLSTEPRAMHNKGKGIARPTLEERLSTHSS